MKIGFAGLISFVLLACQTTQNISQNHLDLSKPNQEAQDLSKSKPNQEAQDLSKSKPNQEPQDLSKSNPNQNYKFTTTASFELKLNDLSKNENFEKIDDLEYRYKGSDMNMSVFNYKFKTADEFENFIQSKRTLIHQSYQALISPYYGMIEADKNCMAFAKLNGTEIKLNKNTRFYFMQYPINKWANLADCFTEKPAGVLRYLFFFCVNKKELFEIRTINKFEEPFGQILASCNP